MAAKDYKYPHIFKYSKNSQYKIANNSEISEDYEYGLMSTEGGYIKANNIESVRKVISRHLKLPANKRFNPKLLIRIFPHMKITKKPLEVRMGSGKGRIENPVAVVKKGTIMFQIKGLNHEESLEVLRKSTMKIPVKCKVVKNEKKV